MSHINIRSVNKNLCNLIHYMETLDLSFDVIGLSETWLNGESGDCCKLTGYRAEHSFRSNKTGGGASILISENISYKRREDLALTTDEFECVFIEIQSSSSSRDGPLIGCLYRAPNSNLSTFNDKFSSILSSIKRESKHCFFMGDFNINLLNSDTHTSTSEFIETLYSFEFMPLITKPTRVTDSSATIIDNIFTNYFPKRSGKSGILRTDISDHFPIFYLDDSTSASSRSKVIKTRNYSSKNIQRFKEALVNYDWEKISRIRDANAAFGEFHNQYKILYDAHFPIKISYSVYKNRCIWLTAGLKTSIKTKNRLFLLSLKYPTLSNKSRYKQYKSRLRTLLRQCERDYYDKCFALNKKNMKKS